MQNEQRKDPRVFGYAKAVYVERQTPGYIRDLSRSGCHVSFMQPIPANVGDIITIQVIPEHDPLLAPFQIRLHIRRVIKDTLWFSVGAELESILTQTGAEAFDRLVTYYSTSAGEN
jgi:hypothetical protein